MKVTITGGAGFIGANLARSLASCADIDEVTLLDDLSSGRTTNLDGVDAELIVGSILDQATIAHAVRGADAVVHLAARPSVPRSLEDPFASHDANATGTVRVLEAARAEGVGQVIVASSSSVYGSNPTMPKREDLVPMPLSPYAASKLATEAYALSYHHSFGLPVLAFRFFNVFGPWQPAGHAYAAVVPAFVWAALQGRPLLVDGDGEQTRDFTFVGSVSDIIREAIVRRVTAPAPVNLAFGCRVSLLELIAELEEVIGQPLAVEHRAARVGDVKHSQADSSRLQQLFPMIEPVPLRDGLRTTVDWMRAHGSS